MSDDKVLRFPAVHNGMVNSHANLDLFGGSKAGRGVFCFIDIDLINEQNLLRIINRNTVCSIFDVRERPVFYKPHFKHDSIVSYFYQRQIPYIECCLLYNRGADLQNSLFKRKMRNLIDERLANGFSLFIFDETSDILGWKSDIRYYLKSSVNFNTEMHPRALPGL